MDDLTDPSERTASDPARERLTRITRQWGPDACGSGARVAGGVLDSELARVIRSDGVYAYLRQPGALWGGCSRLSDRVSNRDTTLVAEEPEEPDDGDDGAAAG